MVSNSHPILQVGEFAIAHPYRNWQINFMGYMTLGTALLSLIGSSLIIAHVLGPSGRTKNLAKPNLRILLAMSVNDVIFSAGCLFNFALYPTGFGWDPAKGNMTTCRLFGFLGQMSIATGGFNALLCIYYWLTICRGMDKKMWVRIERFAFCGIFGLFILLGFLGVSWEVYNPFLEGNVCWIAPYPPRCESDLYPDMECDNYRAEQFEFFYVLFSDLWVFSYIVIVCVMNYLIWRKVRQQTKKIEQYQKERKAQSEKLNNEENLDGDSEEWPSATGEDKQNKDIDDNPEMAPPPPPDEPDATPVTSNTKAATTPVNLPDSSWAAASLSVAEPLPSNDRGVVPHPPRRGSKRTTPFLGGGESGNAKLSNDSWAGATLSVLEPPNEAMAPSRSAAATPSTQPDQQPQRTPFMGTGPAKLGTDSWAGATLSVMEPPSSAEAMPTRQSASAGPSNTQSEQQPKRTPFMGTGPAKLGTDSWAGATLSVMEPPSSVEAAPSSSSASTATNQQQQPKRTPFMAAGPANLGTDSWAGATLSVAEPVPDGPPPGTITTRAAKPSKSRFSRRASGPKRTPFMSGGNANVDKSSWAGATLSVAEPAAAEPQRTPFVTNSGPQQAPLGTDSWAGATLSVIETPIVPPGNNDDDNDDTRSVDSVDDGPYQARNRLEKGKRRGRRRQRKLEEQDQVQAEPDEAALDAADESTAPSTTGTMNDAGLSRDSAASSTSRTKWFAVGLKDSATALMRHTSMNRSGHSQSGNSRSGHSRTSSTYVRRKQEESRARRQRQIFMQCLMFTLSFLLSMLPSMILKVCFIFWGYLAFWQFALLATFWPLQGFFNALIFGRPIYIRVRDRYPELSFWETMHQVFFTEDPLQRTTTVYDRDSKGGSRFSNFFRRSRKSDKDSMNNTGHSRGSKKGSIDAALSDLDYQNQQMLKHSDHAMANSNHSLRERDGRSLYSVAEEDSHRDFSHSNSGRDFYDGDDDVDESTFHNGTEREYDDFLAPLPSEINNESVLASRIRQYEDQQRSDYEAPVEEINEDDFKDDEELYLLSKQSFTRAMATHTQQQVSKGRCHGTIRWCFFSFHGFPLGERQRSNTICNSFATLSRTASHFARESASYFIAANDPNAVALRSHFGFYLRRTHIKQTRPERDKSYC